MRGSLAIWCTTDDTEIAGHAPLVELHFNIWCGLPGNLDVLDIGILFKEARTIKEMFLYFPARIERGQVSDLSQLLRDPTTLSAVFNDTLEVGENKPGSFEVLRNGIITRRVVTVDLESATELLMNSFLEEDGQYGTILTFSTEVISRMSNVGDHYIRLRLMLSGVLAKMLVSHIEPSDRLFLSSFYRTQMIEFRLNEKRNFSKKLIERQRGGRPPKISAVQYFLVRDLDVEMVQSHAAFRKMRRLEPGLWDNYLAGLGSSRPEDMVIYHWRELAEAGNTVEDFIALTYFRQAGRNLWLYIAAIVFLGAIGSSMQSLISGLLARRPNLAGSSFSEAGIQILVISILSVLLLGLYWLVRPNVKSRPFQKKLNNSKTDIGGS
jgi:hypothetical protein